MSVEERIRAPKRRSNETVLRILRGLIALFASLAIIDTLWAHVSTTLHGTTDVIGYPLFANFNVNRYLDAFYLTGFVGPALAIGLYALLARFGPLRRHAQKRKSDRTGEVRDGDEIEASFRRGAHIESMEPAGPRRLMAIGVSVLRVFAVGAVAGLELDTGFHITSLATMSAMILTGLCYLVAIFAVAWIFARATARTAAWLAYASRANSLGAIALVPLLYTISNTTDLFVVSTHETVHYHWLPLWLVIPATLLLLGYLARHIATGQDALVAERRLVYFVVVPVAIFIIEAALPGALGSMDVFGEGEFLAGGWLLMHGVLPWRDLYLIHGVLDDGIKGIVGFQIFGRTRWGATAGMTMLIAPLYWVLTYYFAAVVFFKRPLFVIATACAICLGVFVDWDLRFAFWPVVLVLLYRALQRRTVTRIVALVGALVVQAIFIPEMSYALIACGVTFIAFEIYERHHRWPTLSDMRGTIWASISGALIGGAFVIWLVVEKALSGFIGYFKDFATAHSLVGGIPLYTTYAVTTLPNALGVTLHATASPPVLTRYGLELFLPVLAMVCTAGLITVRVRDGHRLSCQDWLCVAGAILIALYYQKGVSRADVGHIAEVFEVTVPLLLLLVYRLIMGIDNALRNCFSNTSTSSGSTLWQRGRKRVVECVSPASFVALVTVLAVAPISPATLLSTVPSHYHASSPTPAPLSPVAGGPGLGYNVDALPPNVVTDIGRIFDRYAGSHGPVFDFSNAPAIVNFLLDRAPVSRFYNVNDIATPGAEREAIRDLERSKPTVVLFNGIGMGSWDFIPNQIRDGILSAWLLSHYRPLVIVDGQLFLISDAVTTPKPLPKLLGPVRTRSLYYRLGACAWGYIPNFLSVTSRPHAAPISHVHITFVSHGPNGSIYRFIAPQPLTAYHWVSVDVEGAKGDVGLAVSDVGRKSSRDISWVAQGSGITEVEAASCIQWHGFGRRLYLRYLGNGSPTDVTLIG